MRQESLDILDCEINQSKSFFKYIDQLRNEQKQQILQKFYKYNINAMNKSFQKYKSKNKETIPFEFVKSLEFELKDDIVGYQIIAEGKLAIVISSQQNTGFLDIQLPSKKCLFQLYFERIQSLQNLTQKIHGNCLPILIFIMTTNFNHDIITSNLLNSNFYGLNEHQIYFFQQDCLPLLSMDGQILFRNDQQIYEEPIGNGYIFLNKQILETMKCLGITIIQLCSIENVLCKFGDPFWIGAVTRLNLGLSFKCIQRRNPDEKLPIIIKNDKSQLLITGNNYLDLENNNLQVRKMQSLDGVIGQVLCSLDYALNLCQNYKQLLQANFPIREKKCTYYNYEINQFIQPQLAKANALKFELTYYDALLYCPIHKFGLFKVQRDDEYSAIINNSNDNKDTAQTARLAYLQRDLKWIKQLGFQVEFEIEISPKLTYFGEGLFEILQKTNFGKQNKKKQFILDLEEEQSKIQRNQSLHNQMEYNNYPKNLKEQPAKQYKELQDANFSNFNLKWQYSLEQLNYESQKQIKSTSRNSLNQISDTFKNDIQVDKSDYYENNFRQNPH